MSSSRAIKAFSELRDLEIFDSEHQLCGIADDIELKGAPPRVTALLVGPGAFCQRLPPPFRGLVRRVFGGHVVRAPWEAVAHVTSRITLNRTAAELGLNAPERRLAPLLRFWRGG